MVGGKKVWGVAGECGRKRAGGGVLILLLPFGGSLTRRFRSSGKFSAVLVVRLGRFGPSGSSLNCSKASEL